MISFSQFGWERERQRERGFFSTHIRPFSWDPFMMLRVICVLRAFPLLWDRYTLSPSLFQSLSVFHPHRPPHLPLLFASALCPNCLKSVVYYPNKGFCKWISAGTGGGSILSDWRTTSAWRWASLALKFRKLWVVSILETTLLHSTHSPSGFGGVSWPRVVVPPRVLYFNSKSEQANIIFCCSQNTSSA